MRTNLGLDERTTGSPAPRRTLSELKVPARKAKAAHKLGATARSFAILEHVAGSPTPVDVFDIIATLKLTKATAYRLVDWCVTQGYLAREPGRRRLIIGPKLTNLALGALSSSMRNDTPHVVLQRLVHTVNETCNIGKLYLALAASVRRRRLLQSLELRRFTSTTLTDATQLEAELRLIREEQVSFDREEYLAGVVCMAVPVIGKNGELLAALAIQAPEARMNVQTARRHLPALRQAAEELAGIFQDRP